MSNVYPKPQGEPPRTPLQEFVGKRLAELKLSTREAAARTHGLIAHQTLSRLVGSAVYDAKVTERTIAGLALALDLPSSVVQEVAAAPSQSLMAEACKVFTALPEPSRDKALQYMRGLSRESSPAGP